MKPPLLIANWKMKLLPEQERNLAGEIITAIDGKGGKTEVVICPTHLSIDSISSQAGGTDIVLGAQDACWEHEGALTGEISAEALAGYGVKYCIVGHSERRRNFGETDDMINKKALSLLVHSVTPVICVGETHDERREGRQEVTIMRQLRTVLKSLSGDFPIVVAYEPVWAISPNGPAEPEHVAPMAELIYQTLIDRFSPEQVASNIRIIYGGSVDAENIISFLKVPHIAGALLGAASLQSSTFIPLVKTVMQQ
ncbi:MAG: triose-phosphate isomerase [bacterium]|nr:triose-phosphate isomerase [bacterium]